MEKKQLKKQLDVAAGRVPADLVIKNGKVVNVFSGIIEEKDIAVCDGMVAGIGAYCGKEEFDAKGCYVIPGLIESHIHIESSFLTPEEIGGLLVPHGTTTIIADPHEIVNAAGMDGWNYMLGAAENTALDIKYMIPSCVPATPFEHSGAKINADMMKEMMADDRVLGLGEYMNVPGVIQAEDEELDKLLTAFDAGKKIDGHCPALCGNDLNAYVAAGISTDHECSTVEEMQERINRGMYVQIRQGSACHDLVKLLKGLNAINSRRCVLCSDDRQPKTIFEEGHLDGHLRMCVKEGIDPVVAVQMATLNASECYGLSDRGAIAPGRRADFVFVKDLADFAVWAVFIKGKLVAEDGKYLPEINKKEITSVMSSVKVKDFSAEKLKLHLKSSHVHVIDIQPGSIVTGKGLAEVEVDEQGDFVYHPEKDICKIAVVERHHGTGLVSVGLLRGYGIQTGAAAISVAHDSHNIIVAGVCEEDMAYAVRELIRMQGGAVLVRNGKTLEAMPLPVGGLMSDQSGEWVDEKLTALHETACEQLGVSREIDPLMTLCFMALPVVPELKITDMGLFDVERFTFIPLEESLKED